MTASALDFARSRALTGIAGDRGEADDHGDLLSGQLADLVEAGDEGDGGDRADAGDGSEDLEASGEGRIGFDPCSISACSLAIAISTARNWRFSSPMSTAVLLSPIWLRRAVRAATAPWRPFAS